MNQLIFENVVLGYDGKVILENLNFKVSKKDYVVILGDNGFGKTTLIKTILNIIPLISGKIIRSDDLTSSDIGYLPQQTSLQKDFPATVYEIVLSGCANKLSGRFFYRDSEKKLALENLEKLGITSLKDSSFRNLSGGQQQRVLLARALCSNSKILLLDEPVAGLDPKSTLEMYSIIKRLNEENDTTILMISHDTKSALKYASHVLEISNDTAYTTKDEYLFRLGDKDNGNI